MATKLFIGSLPYSTTEEELAQFFAAAGTITSTKLIIDHETGRSKGFGFVEYENDDDAKAAIQKFHGSEFGGRKLVVSEARPQTSRKRR